MARPSILVSNDDGIHAEGLHALEAALREFADVVTVAPESEQSAASHALSLARPLRLRRAGENRWAVDGTPADCVYVALHHPTLLPRKPDLVVSGINHGPNLGSDVFYSGTVAAAREGTLRGVDALAVSLAQGGKRDEAAALAVRVAQQILKTGKTPRPRQLFSLNIPAGTVRGLRATSLGVRLYEDLVDLRTDPRGRQYLWIGGPVVSHTAVEGTDTAAQESGYASLTPLSIDLYAPNGSPLATAIARTARRGPTRTRRIAR